MKALVTAGGIPKSDNPLYKYSKGQPKALIEISSKPLLQWVLDAISNSKTIDSVVVVGIDKGNFVCTKPTVFVPNQGGMVSNIIEGIRNMGLNEDELETPIMIISSDIPSITGEMIDWTANSASETDHDFYYNIVEKSVMENRFPLSNRTFIKVKNAEICGGDLNIIKPWIATAKEDLWEELAGSRKSFIKQITVVGFDTLFLVLLRLLDLNGIAKQGSKKLGMECRAVINPFAEIAMDIDKPHQYEILAQELQDKT